MIGAVWGSGVDVAGDQATIAANKRWQSKLITTSGTLVVPDDVGVIWVDGCGPGGGGGGGDPTPGGGGSGGGAAVGIVYAPLPVVPGETLTITIGATGIGGAVGANGTDGGNTIIEGSRFKVQLYGGWKGQKGTSGAGGAAIGYPFQAGGNTQIGPNGPFSGNAATALGDAYHITKSGDGGALNVSGLYSMSLPTLYVPGVTGYAAGGAGNASGGGGGGGASCTFGMGGNGGAGGVAGLTPYSYFYGSGGGGGGGNAAGGNGAPGMLRIYAFSATTI